MSCQLQECTSSLWEVAEFSLPSGPIETHSVPTRDSASTADLLAFLVGCQTQLVMPASCHCSNLQAQHVCIGLREPDRWAALSTDLQRLLRPPSGAGVRFQFLPASEPPTSGIRLLSVPGVDSVVLFQPSLDSMAGIVRLLEAGRTPLLVADRPLLAPSSAGLGRILRVLHRRYPRLACVALRGGASEATLSSYRLPLTALLAALLAELLEIRQVHTFEDATASAGLFEWSAPGLRPLPSPRALSTLNAVLRRLGSDCRFENPFAETSPFEVVEGLRATGFSSEELHRVVSAATTACCGTCPRCLVQHIALKALCALDVSHNDVLDHPEAASPDDFACLVQFLTCVLDFEGMSDEALTGLFPDLFCGPHVRYQQRMTACRRAVGQIRWGLGAHFPSVSHLL